MYIYIYREREQQDYNTTIARTFAIFSSLMFVYGNGTNVYNIYCTYIKLIIIKNIIIKLNFFIICNSINLDNKSIIGYTK